MNIDYKYKRTYLFHCYTSFDGIRGFDYDSERGTRRALQDEYTLYEDYIERKFGISTKRNCTSKPYKRIPYKSL